MDRYIRISEHLFNELRKLALDRKESTNDVITRLFGFNPAKRKRQFFLDRIEIGQSALIPWDGPRRKRHPAILAALSDEFKRNGKVFERTSTPDGLLIKRVK